jgi:hypothetical protein
LYFTALESKLTVGAENHFMLSRESLEEYRRMTNAERLRITLEMIRENTPYLLRGTPEQVDRRFELLRRQNDERNRRMLEGIARTIKRP